MTNEEYKQALYCARQSAEESVCEECEFYKNCDHSRQKYIAQLWIESLEENDKLKAGIEILEQNIIDSANQTYSMQKLDHELLTKEIEQLKAELEQSMKLPIKIGEFGYVNCHNIENGILITKQEKVEIIMYHIEKCNILTEFILNGLRSELISKYVYKTKEKAEQALKGDTNND